MGTRHTIRWIALVSLALSIAQATLAQETQTEPKKYMTAQARMAAAKAVYLRSVGGTEVPFNIIQAGIESWPRYTIVNSPDKADLLIEVLAPEESTGTSVSSKTSHDSKTGQPKSSTSTEQQFSAIETIRMTVLDAKTKVVLFAATEKPKNAWKERARTESQIECAQKLLAAFRNRIEPENAPSASK